MLKRYGILAVAVVFVGAMAAVRLFRTDPPPAPPAVPERPALETPPPATPLTPPTPRTTTPPKRHDTALATRTPPPIRFEPTERLAELMALQELLRPEIIGDLSRHIEKEGESLAAEGLLLPLQGLLDQLLAGRTLREAIGWLVESHRIAGRDAVMGHIDYQFRHVRARAAEGADPEKIKQDQDRLNRLQELRTELERSLLGP